MIKYIFIDESALDALILNKQYQAFSFEKAKNLVGLIMNDIDSYYDGLIEGFYDQKTKGLILVTKESTLLKGVFFDFETFHFTKSLSHVQIIPILQKILKFYKRHSSGNVFSSCERILSNDRALVFPFPFSISSNDSYRILIDRTPFSKRLSKREANYIQIFGGGFGTIDIQPEYNNIRKFFDSRLELKGQSKAISGQLIAPTVKRVSIQTANIIGNSYSIDGELDYDSWLEHLTSNQKEFILKPISGPERLDGAAGTGKTLSLILKTITHIKNAVFDKSPFRIIFITHTTSTKNQIEFRFKTIYPEIEAFMNGNDSYESLEITTLNDWCIEHLGQTIEEGQLLERDAQDSKTHQYLIIEEIYNNVHERDYLTYQNLLSHDFKKFLDETEMEPLIEMLQFEIGIIIKGRAEEDIDKYFDLLYTRSPYSIPATNKADLDFLFLIYTEYKKRLSNVDQYDVDDIVLSSLAILKTPIWRRRKAIEGYDFVVVDESHLFNFNELSVFHNFLKNEASNNIIFAIDKAQAVGDRGLTEKIMNEQLNLHSSIQKNKYYTVFRSSPDIVNLAYSVLCSGANLFMERFENPFDTSTEYSFTQEEELKSKMPDSYALESYEKVISCSFKLAEEISDELKCSKNEVLLIASTDTVLDDLERFGRENNKPVEILKKRGDFEVLKNAKRTNRFVIGGIDYVGGLEFQVVILVGTDKGRVPPVETEKTNSFHFVNYAWHNRLYVAITRAKYRIVITYEKSRSISPILNSAIQLGYLNENKM